MQVRGVRVRRKTVLVAGIAFLLVAPHCGGRTENGDGVFGPGTGGAGTAGIVTFGSGGGGGNASGGFAAGGTGTGGTAAGRGGSGAGTGGTAAGRAGIGGTGTARPDGGGASGRGGSAGSCSNDLERCQRNTDCCGFSTGNNLCVDSGDAQLGTACLIACTSETECLSGCCAPLGSGGSVCGPSELCTECSALDLEPCARNGDCCGFATGENVCVDTGPAPDGIGQVCLIVCARGSDCQSGCCAPVDNVASTRVCSPSSRCP
jgi:hypothetical protein